MRNARLTLCGTLGLLSALLVGCAGGATYGYTDYTVRDHVYVDRYHRHYHPPRYYPSRHVPPYAPRNSGGFIGGGGHPDAPSSGGFVGGTAPAVSASQAAAPRVRGVTPSREATDKPEVPRASSGGFSGGSAGSFAGGS